MLQLIRAVFRDTNDRTSLSLLFANQSEDDILLREELEDVQKQFPERFKLWYTVDRPTEGNCLQYITLLVTTKLIAYLHSSKMRSNTSYFFRLEIQ